MKSILTILTMLVILLFTVNNAKADPFTVSVTSVKVNGQSVTTDGNWQNLDGLRVKIMPQGTHDPSNDSMGLFWSGLLSSSQNRWTVDILADICMDGNCAKSVQLTGAIARSTEGAYWQLPPSSFTIQGSGGLLLINSITNEPGGIGRNPTSTIDLNIAVSTPPKINAETPEPATLFLLGGGLMGIGMRLRKRRSG